MGIICVPFCADRVLLFEEHRASCAFYLFPILICDENTCLENNCVLACSLAGCGVGLARFGDVSEQLFPFDQ